MTFPVADALSRAFLAASPRHLATGTPWRSALIHGAVLLAWAALTLMALRPGLLWIWSVGFVYVAYDTGLLLFTAWSTRGLGLLADGAGHPPCPPHALEPGVITAHRLTVGVIIAAHNEARGLPATLAALQGQGRPADLVVIADDGSTDDTANLLRERYGLTPEPPQAGAAGQAPETTGAAAPGPLAAAALQPTEGGGSSIAVAPVCQPFAVDGGLHWLRLTKAGKASALNAALPRMPVDIVLTIDADTLLEPDGLAAVEQAFQQQPCLVAASGVLYPVCAANLQGQVLAWFQTYEYLRNYLSRVAWARADGLLLISGALAAFRRDAVLAVGGFDTRCLVEDYELIHRLRRFGALHGLGWTTCVVGGARACTEAPSTVAAFVRQRRRWFGGFLQTQYWYRAMVGDIRYGTVGTRMLPVKAIDTLQPLFGLTALAVALTQLAEGHWRVLVPVAGVILGKIAIDLLFHLWSVHLYRRWLGLPARAAGPHLLPALLAALIEPFTFQILRHTSAALGWWSFLRGGDSWGAQARVADLPGDFALEPADRRRD